MATTTNRREELNRRRRLEPAEPLARQTRDRREEDRRVSVRTLRRLTIVEHPDGLTQKVPGDVSLEGACFLTPAAAVSSQVEVRLRLRDRAELRLPATVKRAERVGRATAVHVRFDPMDVRTELALARLLDLDARG